MSQSSSLTNIYKIVTNGVKFILVQFLIEDLNVDLNENSSDFS